MESFPLGEGNGHTPLGTSSRCWGRLASRKPGGETLPKRKTPRQTIGSHSSRFQPGFVWAALASSELFWANSLQCGSPPEVYFTLKKESRELEIIKVVKHLN